MKMNENENGGDKVNDEWVVNEESGVGLLALNLLVARSCHFYEVFKQS